MTIFSIDIDIAWLLSTVIGLLLIIFELGLIFWIKIAGFSITAAITAIVTLSLAGLSFIICFVDFYIRIIRAAVFLHPKDLESIEHNAITNVASLHTSSTTTLTTRISGNR
ncbi:unnamed protein product [Rotaria socialis]|uniref:Uncharacterized protein n=1 Tax=Rotaria socialis TaxID=392032 RepID=A0A818VAA8_9BILA|nr:unnamed protein product [Rotaria socialis]CAF3677857.1 unnamed protein product [Rotaria socialis]CAF3705976.1 unnamed protein product [Rotaria socialis]CAF4282842.1 unnamed protein product [Rotaria socialis]CAF4525692.1 unnamed protein product [Rotaria socialis]